MWTCPYQTGHLAPHTIWQAVRRFRRPSNGTIRIQIASRACKPHVQQAVTHAAKWLAAFQEYGGQGRPAILAQGYIPHVKGRRQEVGELKRHPDKRARRWIVEVAHSWFNRFRKLLVRYEKLERSFVALNHLAAAIIAFRKVPLAVNIIYG